MDKWRHKYNDDAKQKRAQFIDISSDLREVFKFAHPEQIMKAVQVYASDAYMHSIIRTSIGKGHGKFSL